MSIFTFGFYLTRFNGSKFNISILVGIELAF